MRKEQNKDYGLQSNTGASRTNQVQLRESRTKSFLAIASEIDPSVIIVFSDWVSVTPIGTGWYT